jgi:imidazole glycerol-phosphate synthase subunit HisH
MLPALRKISSPIEHRVMVVVVNYGVGNIGSILNMLKKVGVEAVGSSAETDICAAEKLILPGVGAYDTAMAKIESVGLIPMLRDRVLNAGVPLLGICLGMQLLTKGSEEGSRRGLGWVDAQVVRFEKEKASGDIRIPHMGWNKVKPMQDHPLFRNLEDKARFYFVHSYHVVCGKERVLSTTTYGYEFVSAMIQDNILGVQFHPEKSHKFGFQLLKNFVEW